MEEEIESFRLTSTVETITAMLDANPQAWRSHLPAIREIITSTELLATTPDGARKTWHLGLIQLFQRVAFADADNGGVLDIGNWCLGQALMLLSIYPQEADILEVIGRNWLLRAQKSLASIHLTERESSSSGGSSVGLMSVNEKTRNDHREMREAESRLYAADYVEARGILLPATEYLERAVECAREQRNLSGQLLCSAAEAFMSIGNVSPSRLNGPYYEKALRYLQTAKEIQGFNLPDHLEQYLEEYGLTVN